MFDSTKSSSTVRNIINIKPSNGCVGLYKSHPLSIITRIPRDDYGYTDHVLHHLNPEMPINPNYKRIPIQSLTDEDREREPIVLLQILPDGDKYYLIEYMKKSDYEKLYPELFSE